MPKTIPPPEKIRILALRALVREQQYRVLRKRKRYSLAGAVNSVAMAATRENEFSLHATFLAIEAECQRLLKLDGLSEELLLRTATEWEALPDGLPPSAAIVLTPTFATLLRAARPALARRNRQQRAARQEASASLF